jgi:uncharacterized repeat protein (TIGR01451 family)
MKRRNGKFFFLSGLLSAILIGTAGAQIPAGSAVVNTAYVSYDGGAGSVITLPTDTVVTRIQAGLLRVVKTAGAGSVSAGDTLAYEIIARNDGSAPLTRVAIRDSLPGMLSFISSSPAGTAGGDAVEWVFPVLDPGASVTVRFTCRVLKTKYVPNIVNRVLFSADGVPAAWSAPSVVGWTPWSGAALDKSVSPSEAFIGDTLTYTLTARNTGVTALKNAAVLDTLPTGLSYISSDQPVTIDRSVVTWAVGALAPGAEAVLKLKTLVTSAVSGNILMNRAVLISDETPAAGDAAEAVFKGSGAGIGIEKLAKDTVYTAGDTVTYHLVLGNSGVRPGTAITVLDTLPPGLVYISSSHDGAFEDGVAVWRLNRLDAGRIDTLHLNAKIDVPVANGTRIHNIAWVRTSEGASDSSHWRIRVHSNPGVSFTKTAGAPVCAPGDTLDYTLTALNTGTVLLDGVTITDSLPSDLIYLSSDPAASAAGRVLKWNLGTLGYREKRNFIIRTLVAPDAPVDSIRNTAVLDSRGTDRIPASAATAFNASGNGIEIIKEAASHDWFAGDTLTYDLILSNGVIFPETRITLLDTLDARLRFIGATHGGTFRDGVASWTLTGLAPGYHDTLRMTATIPRPIEDQSVIDNRVWAYSSAGPQDSSRWGITVTSPPVLRLDITGPRTTFIGDTFRYELVYANIGDITAFRPVLIDTLPEYLEFAGATGPFAYDESARTVAALQKTDGGRNRVPSPNGSSYSGGSTGAVIWTLPDLHPGDRDTVYLDVAVTERLGSRLKVDDIAWLTCLHSMGAIRVTDAAVTILERNGLFLYKTVDRAEASPGDTLTYTLRFGALDGDITGEARIVDALPKELRLIPESVLCKPSARLASYDPILNRIEFIQFDLTAGETDSIVLKAVVLPDLAPGTVLVENTAFMACGNDTVHSSADGRTRARTRLVRSFLSIQKTVNRKVAEGGDALTYTVTVTNGSAADSLSRLEIRDILPEGFRYQPGSALFDSIRAPDPLIALDGKRPVMTWTLERALPPGGRLLVKYRVLIGLSVDRGEHENVVTASGRTPDGVTVSSGEARAAVLVSSGAFDERGLIIGKVYEDTDGNGLHNDGEPGVRNVELILEDGTRVRTDGSGKYSIPDVEQGQHVLRLNERTLPEGQRIRATDFGFLDDPRSRLIQVPPGGMAKANFTLENSVPNGGGSP